MSLVPTEVSDYYFMLIYAMLERKSISTGEMRCPFQNNTANRMEDTTSKRKLSTYLRL